MGDSNVRITGGRQLTRNALFNSGSWLIQIVVAFATLPYMVLKLTPEGYGTYALLTGLIGYTVLFDLGLGQGIVKFVAEFHVVDDDRAVSRFVNAGLWLQCGMGVIGSASIIGAANPILTVLRIPDGLLDEARVALYLCGVGFFLTMFVASFHAALQGVQRYDLTSKVDAVGATITSLATVALLAMGYGLVAAVGVYVIKIMSTLIVKVGMLYRVLPSWRPWEIPGQTEIRQLFNFSGFLFLSRISAVFSNYLARFVITFFLGPAAVTLYVVPQKLINSVGGLLNGAFGVLFPYASQLGARRERDQVQRVFLHGSRLFASFAIPSLLVLLVFSKPILAIWMGEDFAATGWQVLSLMAFTSLLGSLTVIPNYIVIGLGHAKIRSYFAVAEIVLFVIFLPLGTRTFGITGTVWAVMIASSLPGLVFVAFATRRIVELKIAAYARHVIGFHIVPILTALAIVRITSRLEIHASYWAIPASVILLILYFASMAATGWVPLAHLARLSRS